MNPACCPAAAQLAAAQQQKPLLQTPHRMTPLFTQNHHRIRDPDRVILEVAQLEVAQMEVAQLKVAQPLAAVHPPLRARFIYHLLKPRRFKRVLPLLKFLQQNKPPQTRLRHKKQKNYELPKQRQIVLPQSERLSA